jgi:hypothetical protein
MNEERDVELGAALRTLPTPEHRPGFWEELEDRLASEAPPGAGGSRRYRRDRRDRRRPFPGPMLLAVAAAVAVVVGAVAVLLPDDREGTQVVTEPTTTTTTAAPDYRPGPEQSLGAGSVLGVTGDGTAALVVGPDAGSDQPGCEGTGASALFAAPFDGGARQRSVAGAEVLTGRLLRNPADPGRVAVVSVCEEFLSGAYVAREQPGGVFTDVTPVAEGALEGLVPQFKWSADGTRLLAVVSETWDVVKIDPSTGSRATVLPAADAFQAAELADGTLAVLTRDGRLRLGGEVLDIAGVDMVVSPDGQQLAIHGPDGLFLIAPGSTRRIVTDPVAGVSWSPDGRALAVTAQSSDLAVGRLSVVTVEGSVTEIAGDGIVGTAWFAPDGRALAFTRVEPGEGDGEADVAREQAVLVRFG